MITEVISTLKTAIPIIAIIFVCILTLILIIRLVFIFLLNQARKKYLLLKNKSKNILTKKKKNYSQKDEEIFLEKQDPLERKIDKENTIKYQKINSLDQENQEQQSQQQTDDTQIVGIVKPIGFFTSMILGQKLTFLVQSAQIINQRGKKGFWVSMIEAQERAAGRQRGRGR